MVIEGILIVEDTKKDKDYVFHVCVCDVDTLRWRTREQVFAISIFFRIFLFDPSFLPSTNDSGEVLEWTMGK